MVRSIDVKAQDARNKCDVLGCIQAAHAHGKFILGSEVIELTFSLFEDLASHTIFPAAGASYGR